SEAATDRAGGLIILASAQSGAVSAHPAGSDCGTLSGGLSDQVDGTTDTVGVHVGLECFVDFNGLDDVGGNGVEFDLTHAGFRGRDVDAINGGVGEAWLGAADLNIFAFALVALDGDARQTSQ